MINVKFSLAKAVVFALLLLAFGIFAAPRAYAATGSSATGAEIIDYSDKIIINVVTDCEADNTGTEDATSAIQDALDAAIDQASDEVCVEVRVPAGTYNISTTLKIYSNTRLVLNEDATIVKCFSAGAMLRNARNDGKNGRYNGNHNIVIKGGTWDGNTDNYSNVYYFSNIRIAHAQNVIIKNVSVLNNKNGHHIEIGGVKGLTITGCYFSGYTGSLLKEAIQLDVMNNSELYAGYSPFDDTTCKNVLITDNTFYKLSRGIGSHSAVAGVYYTNITIKNNTFEKCTDIAMILYNYKHCTISGNTIKNCGAGITFNYMSDEDFEHYYAPVDGLNSTKSSISSNADTIISDNDITTKDTSDNFAPFGIKIYGVVVGQATDTYPAADYTISNVRISGNEIKTMGSALILQNVSSSSVRENTIRAREVANESYLVRLLSCTDVSFSSNSVSNSLKSGVAVNGGSGYTISKNSFKTNTGVGLLVSNAADSKITQNSFSLNALGGIKLDEGSGSVECTSNIIKQSGGYGIKLDASADCVIKSNDITGADYGIYCTKTATATVSENTFETVSDKVYAQADGLIAVQIKNFSVEETLSNTVKLTWTAMNEADGINVYRAAAGTDEFELIATLENGSIYQDDSLRSATNYKYKIVPFIDVDGTSCENTSSNIITARTKYNIETSYVECVSQARFTAKPITPSFKIEANSIELVEGIDYDYSFSNNIYVGTATLTITGKGDYIGTLTYNFEITLDGERVNNTAAKNTTGVFSTDNTVKVYNVEINSISDSVLADSDETVNAAKRTLDAIYSQVPYEIKVKTGVWNGSGYVFY